MDREERARLQTIIKQLVRQPPPVEQSDLRSALNLLTNARSDAAWLLLNRVMLLEADLAAVQRELDAR